MQTIINSDKTAKELDRINIMLKIEDRVGMVKLPDTHVDLGQMVCTTSYVDPSFKIAGSDDGTSDIAALFDQAHKELDKLQLMVEKSRSKNKEKMKIESQAIDAGHEIGLAAMGGMNLDDDSAGMMVDSRASKL